MSYHHWNLDNNTTNFNIIQKYIDQIQAFVVYNPAFYIHEYFDKLINEVDIAREELKVKIDNYSDEIIQKIQNNKKDAVDIAENLKGTIVDPMNYMSKYKDDLSSLAHQIQFINMHNYIEHKEIILQKSWHTYLEFDNIVTNYKKLIMNNKDYYFYTARRTRLYPFNQEKKVRIF